MAEKAQTLTLPLLVTRSLVIYPFTSQIIEAGRPFSLKAIETARTQTDSLLFVSCQKNVDDEQPKGDQIHDIGCLCRVISYSLRGTQVRIRVEVVDRVKLNSIHDDERGEFLVALGEIYRLDDADYLIEDTMLIGYNLTSQDEIINITNDKINFFVANFTVTKTEKKFFLIDI